MAEPPFEDRLLGWTLGSFHAGLFVLTIVVALYRTGGLGDLLGALNTLLGLGIYALLWAVTGWTAQRALRGLDWRVSAAHDPGELLLRGLTWGGVTGVLFLLGLGVFLLIILVGGASAAIQAGARSPRISGGDLLALMLGGPLLLLVASVVAYVVGAIVGAVLALVDALVLAAAFLLRDRSQRLDAAPERPTPTGPGRPRA